MRGPPAWALSRGPAGSAAHRWCSWRSLPPSACRRHPPARCTLKLLPCASCVDRGVSGPWQTSCAWNMAGAGLCPQCQCCWARSEQTELSNTPAAISGKPSVLATAAVPAKQSHKAVKEANVVLHKSDAPQSMERERSTRAVHAPAANTFSAHRPYSCAAARVLGMRDNPNLRPEPSARRSACSRNTGGARNRVFLGLEQHSGSKQHDHRRAHFAGCTTEHPRGRHYGVRVSACCLIMGHPTCSNHALLPQS